MSIIRSLLDTDFYKFTMGQLVHRRYPKVPVRYRLIVRTPGTALADRIAEDDLRNELDQMRTLRFTEAELGYLRDRQAAGRRIFGDDYLEYLRGLKLPPYTLRREGETYHLEFVGAWEETIYWETPALAVVNELYYRALTRDRRSSGSEDWRAEGTERLQRKIERLGEHPEVTFCDFGTRRRFSRSWQREVLTEVAAALPRQFLGTSNVWLAKELGVPSLGTLAHELFMSLAGLMHQSDAAIRASHRRVLEDWWDEYGVGLSIALTDTYGSDFFFRDATDRQAQSWRGVRQDSGDPFVFGEKAIAFYRSRGVDPHGKLVLFSDGLDVDTMIALAERFAGRINVSFGWGTNLTNDVGPSPASMVIKLVEAAGHPCVKLSDNLAKATGQPQAVERFKRIFGYTNTFSEECRY